MGDLAVYAGSEKYGVLLSVSKRSQVLGTEMGVCRFAWKDREQKWTDRRSLC